MTDLLETLFDVEEVKINPIIAALTIPHNPQIERNVRRFGFEYEMLPSGDDEYVDYDDIEVDTDDVWSDNHNPCNCEDCLGERMGERRDEIAREMRLNGGGMSRQLIERAYDARLVRSTDKCYYHCSCDTCNHSRKGPLLTAQSDCSCGVEFISRIIDLDDFDTARDGIAAWVHIMQRWKDDGMWMPDGHTANGNHVHVSKRGDDDMAFSDHQMRQARNHINTLYSVFDWVDVADGGCGSIRPYNSKPHNGDSGGWLSDRGYGTFEHRLWNTPLIPERLWAHIGLSIAITRWAFAIAVEMPYFSFGTPDSYRGGTRITSDTIEMMHYATDEIVRGITSYIPHEPCFDIARDLILSLS